MHGVSIMQTNCLMSFREIIAMYRASWKVQFMNGNIGGGIF